MPNWHLRSNSHVSQGISSKLLFPTQPSPTDAAVHHFDFQEKAAFHSFLQLANGGALQASDELFILALIALVFVAILLVGGIALWYTSYDKAGALKASFDEDLFSHHKAARESERRKYGDIQKVSQAQTAFPSHTLTLVGNEITVEGVLTTNPENVILQVCASEGNMVARAVVCEKGPDPGILIEDAFSVPLVFIDTSATVHKTEKNPTLRIYKLGEDEGYFGMARLEDEHGRLVVRSHSGRLRMALQGDSLGRSLNAVNERSQLAATIQRSQGNSFTKVVMLPGSDAGVLICGLLAVWKIGRPDIESRHDSRGHLVADISLNMGGHVVKNK